MQTENPGKCEGAWNLKEKALVPEKFMDCFDFFLTSSGARYAADVNMDEGKTRITSFRQSIDLIYIEDSASDGVELLEDFKRLCSEA